MEQFASTYMELGFAGIVAILFGYMILNLIKSQNAQTEDLEKIKIEKIVNLIVFN